MMGRKSMPNANFVHRNQSIKVNYPADRPKEIGASNQNVNTTSGEIDVKKSVAFSKASASKKGNDSFVEVGENHTDRISLNQKDEDPELTFNQMKNFHTSNKVDGSSGNITGIAGLQEELPEDMKQDEKLHTVLMATDTHSIE